MQGIVTAGPVSLQSPFELSLGRTHRRRCGPGMGHAGWEFLSDPERENVVVSAIE